MKSYEETITTVFHRMNEYEAMQAKRKAILVRSISLFACLCLIVAGTWLALPPETALSVTPHLSTGQNFSLPTEPPVTSLDMIRVNPIDSISSSLMYIALFREDYVKMTDAELIDYFGLDFFPEVPADLGEEWSKKNGVSLGIYKRNGGTGEIYHDDIKLTWTNADQSRGVSIQISKDQMPYTFFHLLTTGEFSLIRDTDVGIWQDSRGTYLVEFMYRNVGFRMITEGLSLEETVAVIESILT